MRTLMLHADDSFSLAVGVHRCEEAACSAKVAADIATLLVQHGIYVQLRFAISLICHTGIILHISCQPPPTRGNQQKRRTSK